MPFMKKFTLPQYKNFHFILLMLVFLVKWNVVRLKMIVSMITNRKNKAKERLCRKISKTNSIEIQSQNWCVNRQLSMKGIAVEYFPY